MPVNMHITKWPKGHTGKGYCCPADVIWYKRLHPAERISNMRHLINLRSLIKCTSTSKQSLMRLCCISPAYNAALVWCGREAVEQAGLSRRGRLSRVLHGRSHCRPLCCSSPPSTLFSFTTCWGSFFSFEIWLSLWIMVTSDECWPNVCIPASKHRPAWQVALQTSMHWPVE